MSQLKIVFAGVGAIGPAHPLEGRPENKGPLFVAFPKATRQQAATHGGNGNGNGNGDGSFIGVHWPHLTTTIEPRRGTRRPDKPASKMSRVHFWQPHRERLTFSFEGDWSPQSLVYDVGGAGDVNLLADMRKIFPQRSLLKPGALGLPAIPEVDGQVFVPGGLISSSFGSKDPVRARFEPARTATQVEQLLAPELVVTVNGITGVKIVSESLDTGKPLDAIEFDLPNDGEIRFGSEDILDIFRLLDFEPKPERTDGDFHDEPDIDFALYSPILQGDPQLGVPIPIKKVRGFGSPFGVDGNCYVTLVGGGG